MGHAIGIFIIKHILCFMDLMMYNIIIMLSIQGDLV